MQQQRIFKKKRSTLTLTTMGKGRIRVEGNIVFDRTDMTGLITELQQLTKEEQNGTEAHV